MIGLMVAQMTIGRNPLSSRLMALSGYALNVVIPINGVNGVTATSRRGWLFPLAQVRIAAGTAQKRFGAASSAVRNDSIETYRPRANSSKRSDRTEQAFSPPCHFRAGKRPPCDTSLWVSRLSPQSPTLLRPVGNLYLQSKVSDERDALPPDCSEAASSHQKKQQSLAKFITAADVKGSGAVASA
jgi:hypothetical protein